MKNKSPVLLTVACLIFAAKTLAAAPYTVISTGSPATPDDTTDSLAYALNQNDVAANGILLAGDLTSWADWSGTLRPIFALSAGETVAFDLDGYTLANNAAFTLNTGAGGFSFSNGTVGIATTALRIAASGDITLRDATGLAATLTLDGGSRLQLADGTTFSATTLALNAGSRLALADSASFSAENLALNGTAEISLTETGHLQIQNATTLGGTAAFTLALSDDATADFNSHLNLSGAGKTITLADSAVLAIDGDFTLAGGARLDTGTGGNATVRIGGDILIRDLAFDSASARVAAINGTGALFWTGETLEIADGAWLDLRTLAVNAGAVGALDIAAGQTLVVSGADGHTAPDGTVEAFGSRLDLDGDLTVNGTVVFSDSANVVGIDNLTVASGGGILFDGVGEQKVNAADLFYPRTAIGGRFVVNGTASVTDIDGNSYAASTLTGGRHLTGVTATDAIGATVIGDTAVGRFDVSGVVSGVRSTLDTQTLIIGNAAGGTLNIWDGALVHVPAASSGDPADAAVVLAVQAGSSATLDVNGVSIGLVYRPSTLDAGYSNIVIGQSGNAYVTVADGAEIHAGGTVLAAAGGSTASVHLSDFTGTAANDNFYSPGHATWVVDGAGVPAAPPPALSGGTGVLNVQGGLVLVRNNGFFSLAGTAAFSTGSSELRLANGTFRNLALAGSGLSQSIAFSNGARLSGTGNVTAGGAITFANANIIAGKNYLYDYGVGTLVLTPGAAGVTIAGGNVFHAILENGNVSGKLQVNGNLTLDSSFKVNLTRLIPGDYTLIETTGGTISGSYNPHKWDYSDLNDNTFFTLNGKPLVGIGGYNTRSIFPSGGIQTRLVDGGTKLVLSIVHANASARNITIYWDRGNGIWDLIARSWGTAETNQSGQFLDGDITVFSGMNTLVEIDSAGVIVAATRIENGSNVTFNGGPVLGYNSTLYTTLAAPTGQLSVSGATLTLNNGNEFYGGTHLGAGAVVNLNHSSGLGVNDLYYGPGMAKGTVFAHGDSLLRVAAGIGDVRNRFVVDAGATLTLDGGPLAVRDIYHIGDGGTFLINGTLNATGAVDLSIHNGITTDGGTVKLEASGVFGNGFRTFTVRDSHALGDDYGFGGGLAVVSGNVSTLATSDGITLADNSAHASGGGISIGSGAEFTLSGNAAIEGNYAAESGGGIFVADNASLTLTTGTGQEMVFQDNLSGVIFPPETIENSAAETSVSSTSSNAIQLSDGAALNINGTGTVRFHDPLATAAATSSVNIGNGTDAPTVVLYGTSDVAGTTTVNTGATLRLANGTTVREGKSVTGDASYGTAASPGFTLHSGATLTGQGTLTATGIALNGDLALDTATTDIGTLTVHGAATVGKSANWFLSLSTPSPAGGTGTTDRVIAAPGSTLAFTSADDTDNLTLSLDALKHGRYVFASGAISNFNIAKNKTGATVSINGDTISDSALPAATAATANLGRAIAVTYREGNNLVLNITARNRNILALADSGTWSDNGQWDFSGYTPAGGTLGSHWVKDDTGPDTDLFVNGDRVTFSGDKDYVIAGVVRPVDLFVEGTGAVTFTGTGGILTLGVGDTNGLTTILPVTNTTGVNDYGIPKYTGLLTKNGSGILTFANTGGNTFAEGIFLNGTSGSGIVFNRADQLRIGAGKKITVNTNSVSQLRYNNATANATLTAPISVGTDAQLVLTVDAANIALALNGVIDGTGRLAKTGDGILTLGGGAANTFSGGTTISSGEIRLAKNTGLSAFEAGNSTKGNVLADGTSRLTTTQAMTLANRFSVTASTFTIAPTGTLTLSGITEGSVASVANGATLRLETNAGNIVISGSASIHALEMDADATLAIDGTGNVILRDEMHSVLLCTVTKDGTGTFIVNADEQSLVSETTVNAGALRILNGHTYGAANAGTFTLAPAAFLSGEGAVQATTATLSGVISADKLGEIITENLNTHTRSIGTISVNAGLALNDVTIRVDLDPNATQTADLLDVTGALNVGDSGTFDLYDFSTGYYRLVKNSAPIAPAWLDGFSINTHDFALTKRHTTTLLLGDDTALPASYGGLSSEVWLAAEQHNLALYWTGDPQRTADKSKNSIWEHSDPNTLPFENWTDDDVHGIYASNEHHFVNGDTVIFQDVNRESPTDANVAVTRITLSENVVVSDMTVDGALNYVFSGTGAVSTTGIVEQAPTLAATQRLYKLGTGTLTFANTAANTFTGGVEIGMAAADGGKIEFANGNQLGVGTGAAIHFTGNGTLTNTAATTLVSTVLIDAAKTATFATDTAALQVSGAVSGGGSILKTGASSLTFADAGTFALGGNLNVEAGSLTFTGTGTGSIGGTFHVMGTSTTGHIVNGALVTLDAPDSIVIQIGTGGTLIISGAGGGMSVSQGGISVEGGTLTVSDGAIITAGDVYVSGGTNAIGTVNIGEGALSGSFETAQIIGDTAGRTVLNFNHTDDAFFDVPVNGTMSLHKIFDGTAGTSGKTTLTAVSDYTGGTFVENGALEIKGDAATAGASGSVVNVGADGTFIIGAQNTDYTLDNVFDGTGTIQAANGRAFAFGADAAAATANGTGFSGNVEMHDTTYAIDATTAAFFTGGAGLVTQAGSVGAVGAGQQDFAGGFTFDGGTVQWGIGAGIIAAQAIVIGNNTTTLDVTLADMGAIVYQRPTYTPGTSLFTLQDTSNTHALATSDYVIAGDVNNLNVLINGTAFTGPVDADLIIEQDNREVATGVVGIGALTSGDGHSLSIGYKLQELLIHGGETLQVVRETTDDFDTFDIAMRDKTPGSAGNVLFVSRNADPVLTLTVASSYTGTTTVDAETELVLAVSNAIDGTSSLIVRETNASVSFSDGTDQSVGALDVADGGKINFGYSSSLTVRNGGTVSGTDALDGIGTLNLSAGTLAVSGANSAVALDVNVAQGVLLTLDDVAGIGTGGASLVTLNTAAAVLRFVSGTDGVFETAFTGTGRVEVLNGTGAVVTLDADNSGFAGTYVIGAVATEGHLTVTERMTFGNAPHLDIVNGTFTVADDTDWPLSAELSGTGDFIKNGTGALLLARISGSFEGDVAINSGELLLVEALATGTQAAGKLVTVANDATLTLEFTDSYARDLAGVGAVGIPAGADVTVAGANDAFGGVWKIAADATARLDGTDATSTPKLGNGSLVELGGTLDITASDGYTFANALDGTGTLAATLGSEGDTFQFDESVTHTRDASFAGGMFVLEKGTYVFSAADGTDATTGKGAGTLADATLVLGAAGAVALGDADYAVGHLTLAGGTLAVADATPVGLLTVTDLDLSGGGTLALDFSGVGSGVAPIAVNVFDDNGDPAHRVQIVCAIGDVTLGTVALASSGAMSSPPPLLVDFAAADANASSATAYYNYLVRVVDAAATGVGSENGLYFDYGLVRLNANDAGKLFVLDNTDAHSNRLDAQLTSKSVNPSDAGDDSLDIASGFEFRADGTILVGNTTSNYTGETLVSRGTVQFTTDGAFGKTALLTVLAGSTADLDGHTQTTGAVDNAGTIQLSGGALTTGTFANTGHVDLATGGTLTATDGTAATNTGTIGGDDFSGHLVKTGTGTLDLSAASAVKLATLAVDDGTTHLGAALDIRADGTDAVAQRDAAVLFVSGGSIAGTGVLVHATGSGTGAVTLDATSLATTGDTLADVDGHADFQLTLKNVSQLDGKILAVRNGSRAGIDFENSTFAGVIAQDASSSADVALAANAHWRMTGDSQVRHLRNAGQLSFSEPDGGMKTLHVAGDYTGASGSQLVFNTVLGGDDSPTDKLVVAGNTAGRSAVFIRGILTDEEPGAGGIKLIEVGGANADASVFTLGQRVLAGSNEYALRLGDADGTGQDWYLRVAKNSPQASAILGTAASVPGWHLEMDALHRRLGELRTLTPPHADSSQSAADWLAPSPGDSGALGKYGLSTWVRSSGWRNDVGAEVNGAPYREYNYGGDIGADKALRADDGWVYLGGYVGFGKVTRSFSWEADSNTEAVRLGAYATYFDDDGWYADLVLKWSYYDNELAGYTFMEDGTRFGRIKGDYGNFGFGGSLELGRRWESPAGPFVEPQLQFSYGHLTGTSYRTTGADSLGVGLERNDTFQVKGGVMFGARVAFAYGMLQPFAKVYVAGQWTDGGHVSTDDGLYRRVTLDGARVEVGAGLMWQTKNNQQIYFDYEYINARHYEIPWRLNAGYRVSW